MAAAAVFYLLLFLYLKGGVCWLVSGLWPLPRMEFAIYLSANSLVFWVFVCFVFLMFLLLEIEFHPFPPPFFSSWPPDTLFQIPPVCPQVHIGK